MSFHSLSLFKTDGDRGLFFPEVLSHPWSFPSQVLIKTQDGTHPAADPASVALIRIGIHIIIFFGYTDCSCRTADHTER